MSESHFLQEPCTLDYTARAAATAGDVIQLPDGRAAVPANDLEADRPGAVDTVGIYRIAKTADINILNGGKVYFDVSAGKAHFRPEAGTPDFYVGVAVGDSPASQTWVDVSLNTQPVYRLDLARDPYLTTPVGTQAVGGFGPPRRQGGSLAFVLTATNEAQKADAISVDGIKIDARAIVEAAFRIPAGGSGSASDFSIGLADGTHASDADQITTSLLIHLDGGATAINAESDDGTTEVAATDTTKTFTAGTGADKRVEVWFDLRDPADIQIYLNGVLVLPNTVFSLAAATAVLYLLAHLEKASGTETADMTIDWLRARIASE